MKISNKGLNLIKEFEGCRLSAYKCPAGIWTIGYGHTSGVKPNDKINSLDAERLLRQDIVRFEQAVNTIVKVPLNQNQFDALVSFTYNLGAGCLRTLVANRNITQIGNAIKLYNKSNGKVLDGLVRRRNAEYKLFFS